MSRELPLAVAGSIVVHIRVACFMDPAPAPSCVVAPEPRYEIEQAGGGWLPLVVCCKEVQYVVIDVAVRARL